MKESDLEFSISDILAHVVGCSERECILDIIYRIAGTNNYNWYGIAILPQGVDNLESRWFAYRISLEYEIYE